MIKPGDKVTLKKGYKWGNGLFNQQIHTRQSLADNEKMLTVRSITADSAEVIYNGFIWVPLAAINEVPVILYVVIVENEYGGLDWYTLTHDPMTALKHYHDLKRGSLFGSRMPVPFPTIEAWKLFFRDNDMILRITPFEIIEDKPYETRR
jgi:hypothetical protein